jgi:hypothetical protein
MKLKIICSIVVLIAFLLTFTNKIYACHVLVDLNTFSLADKSYISYLKCDGVWAILVNSNLADSDWSTVYKSLGPGWVVTEDNPGGNSDYLRIKKIAGYTNASMCYNETFVPPNVGETQGIGGTILTSSEIVQQSATHGGSIVLLARSYETDGWSAAVDTALANPQVSGVALECYPNRPPLYLDSLRVKELIKACLSKNKNFYFLSPGYDNYTEDMEGYINLLISEGIDFSDNRIYLVGASYDKIAPFIGGSESVQGVIEYYLSIEKRFASTNIKEVSQQANDCYLLQNFPNPFNPTTLIEYSIAKSSFVTLKVYNLLGQEITTLVNQEQKAGNYNINFDAESLASGVYVYRIRVSTLSGQSGSFSLTKKMTLLK